MSLMNCLTCSSDVVQRTDSIAERRSYNQYHDHDQKWKLCCINIVDRSWSGNLSTPYEQIRSGGGGGDGGGVHMLLRKVKKGHRREHSTGTITFEAIDEPRLIRSSGMRRDWSFEDLNGGRNQEGRKF